jgi:choline dehydrogenase-like flavoprotein
MIFDALELPDGHTLNAAICIVGGGAAGIAMALDLLDSGLDVLLLESGGEKEEAATQALYAGAVADPQLHSPPDRYRQRRFGGTTTIWGGRCMPYDAIDFEVRPYMPGSGWPISYEDILPFYPRANSICEAGSFDYRAGTAFSQKLRPMIAGFETPPHFTTDTLERFSCPTNFKVRYHHKLAGSAIRVMLHANVTGIHLDPGGGHVERLTVKTLPGKHAGKTFTVRAARFVLATGGLEVARLLLANRDVHANGIGNAYDVVGRYYMCHVAGTIGAIRFNGRQEDVWNGYEVSEEGIYCRRRLALRPETQRAEGIGNFVARLHHPRVTDPHHNNGILSALYFAKPLIAYEYRKRLIEDQPFSWAVWLHHVRNVMLGAPDAAAFAWHILRDRKLAARKFPSIVIRSKANIYSLDFHAEQAPNPESRIRLGVETDALGMPRLEVDWRYRSEDIDTAKRSLALLAGSLAASGVGFFEYDPAMVEHEMTRYGAYGGHHIGTARMGANPRESVTDADCRVHGVANLYIASAAVFPTSSQANPTLTVVALALRLAQHLKTISARATATVS